MSTHHKSLFRTSTVIDFNSHDAHTCVDPVKGGEKECNAKRVKRKLGVANHYR